MRAASSTRSRLPRGIWVLGFGSLLTDVSSELVHSLLPLFLASVLGASVVTIGVIEGVAEATAAITKAFSGALSDYLRKRKFLIVLGYGLGALSKLVFPLATTIEWVFGARFADRVGKGIRGAPRDALIADLVPEESRGAAYGLRQSLDTVGAFLGPLLAIGFMLLWANDIRAVLWVAVVPAFGAVILLALAVREPETAELGAPVRSRLALRDAGRLDRSYWAIVALGSVFTLARFSEAFLILRAHDVGLTIGFVPLIMIAMNVIYALVAYPAGLAADRFSARVLLIIGLVVLIGADLVLARAGSPALAFVGAGLWGLHMALTQGLFSKLVANAAPEDLRGTAFGFMNLATGVALLIASALAGFLWSRYGAAATFHAGACFAGLSIVGLVLGGSRRDRG